MSKRRHKTIDLGTIAVNDYSQEIDLSSFTHAVLFYEWPSTASGNIVGGTQPEVDVFFSPTEFGETAVWYEMHSQASLVSMPYLGRKIVPNSIAPQIREDSSATTFYERDRAIPIQPTEPSAMFGGFEWVFGQQLLPRRMRLQAIGHALSGYIQLSREIG